MAVKRASYTDAALKLRWKFDVCSGPSSYAPATPGPCFQKINHSSVESRENSDQWGRRGKRERHFKS